MRPMDVGNTIKVHLPGESLWAQVTGRTEDGRTRAQLRNESVHDGIHWGDDVVLASDNYEIEEPAAMVERAEQSCADFRAAALAQEEG